MSAGFDSPSYGWARASNLAIRVALVVLLWTIAPVVARAAEGIEAGTGLLMAPMVDRKPIAVMVGLYLSNLIEVNEVSEEFGISGYLLVTWKDPRLTFNSQGGAERSYNPNSIWIPRLLLINSTKGREKISTIIKGEPNGTIHYLERFAAKLSTSFYLRAFPFDSQSLDIRVEPSLDELDDLALEYDGQGSGVTTDPFVSLAQWKILGLRGSELSRPIGTSGMHISAVDIRLGVQRYSRFYIWKVLLPMIVMTIIPFSVFWVEARQFDWQMKIPVAIMLSLIAFEFAVARDLPRVPYVTLLDAVFLTCFFFVFASTAEIVLIYTLIQDEREELAHNIHWHARWAVPSAYFLAIGLMLPFLFLP